MTTSLHVTLVGFATLALASCSGGDAPTVTETEATSSASQAIVNGTASTNAQDFVVQIAIEQKGKMIPFCSGTLVAKNLVITARHCVGDFGPDKESITDFPASKLKFYFGTGAGPKTINKDPEAQGLKIFDDGKKSLVPDIALVQLDREVDLPVVPIRLESGAVKGELIDIVGYGVTEQGSYPRARQQRKGVKVAKIGPGRSKLFDLTAGEFQFGEAACAGDSGGPALSSDTGALVGVASRVSNGTARSDGNASFCIGNATEDVYTDLTPAKAYIDAAFEAAGATPWLEGEPSPEEKAALEAAAQQKPEQAKISQGCSTTGRASNQTSLAATFLFGTLLALGRRRKSATAS
jgi:secreted trypsin-like serine protease